MYILSKTRKNSSARSSQRGIRRGVRRGWKPGAEAGSMPGAEPDAAPDTEPDPASGAGAGLGSRGNNVNSGFWDILGLRSPSPEFRRAVHSIRQITARSRVCGWNLRPSSVLGRPSGRASARRSKKTSGSGTQYCNGNTAGAGRTGAAEAQAPWAAAPLHFAPTLLVGGRAVLQLLWRETTAAEWLFPQEKATLHDS
jgi:hypothetical protein